MLPENQAESRQLSAITDGHKAGEDQSFTDHDMQVCVGIYFVHVFENKYCSPPPATLPRNISQTIMGGGECNKRTKKKDSGQQCCGSGSGRIRTFLPDPEISPPNPDPDPALVV